MLKFFRTTKETAEAKSEIEKQLDAVMGIEGQISRDEAGALIALTKNAKPGTAIVEIGSYRGRSTIALAAGSAMHNKNRVYAVDPHAEFTGVLGGQFGPTDQEELYKNIVKSGFGKTIAVVSLPSARAAHGWSERNIGLLWIDGDHKYEAVRADYEAWAPFVADGGIIAFHDCNIEGIERLVRELKEKNELRQLGAVDTLSWFSK